MARPWFEATAALSATGVVANAPRPLTFPDLMFRGFDMTDHAFAFVPGSERGAPQSRPIVHATLSMLADAIERRRDGRQIQLVEVEDFELDGREGLFTAVQVFTLDMASDPDGLLGTAWLDGKGRDTLEPALRRARIVATQRAA